MTEPNFRTLTRADVAHDALKTEAETWFVHLRDQICAAFEALEDEAAAQDLPHLPGSTAAGRFERTAWSREAQAWEPPGSSHGGGVMSVMRGRVFEKVGVNVSTVWGTFSPEFRTQIDGAQEDPRFFATGISLVAHPANPHVCAAHFNTRLIVTTKGWFGGGGDITPMFPQSAEAQEDAAAFHAAFARACDAHDPGYYPEFKEWCDRYFFLPHRNEPRGLGGIFFDRFHRGAVEDDFRFVQDVGHAFLEAYPPVVRARMSTPWTDAERDAQRGRRGRYVEFNLLHDRGTTFGLKTGGHVDAILMSMPPDVKWP
jgi:coproporphyrinogen III oxidase